MAFWCHVRFFFLLTVEVEPSTFCNHAGLDVMRASKVIQYVIVSPMNLGAELRQYKVRLIQDEMVR